MGKLKKSFNPNDIDIRYSNQADLPHLESWLKASGVRTWYPISTDQDAHAMAKNWIGFSRFGASLTAVYQELVLGIATLFLMPYKKVAHHCLVYLIVNPVFLRQRVGTILLRNVNHLGKTYFHFENMHAELYEGCPGIPFLKEGGYNEVFRQDHFIKEEDGTYRARVVLEINLGEWSGEQT